MRWNITARDAKTGDVKTFSYTDLSSPTAELAAESFARQFRNLAEVKAEPWTAAADTGVLKPVDPRYVQTGAIESLAAKAQDRPAEPTVPSTVAK